MAGTARLRLTAIDNNLQWHGKLVGELVGPIWGRCIKVWKHTIGNSLNTLGLNIRETIRTQNNTVPNRSIPALFYRYYRNWFRFLPKERLATACAPATPAIRLALSCVSHSNNSRREHFSNLPLYKWYKDCRGYWYHSNGEWTGIHVDKITTLPIYRARDVAKVMKLNHPSFQVSHFIRNETYDIKDTLNIAEAPTLRKAKVLAEQYYKEWLSINWV